MSSYANDAAVAFAMHADTTELTRDEGLELAEKIGEAVEAAALDRPENVEATAMKGGGE